MRSYIKSKHQKPLCTIYSALSVVILTLLFINNTFAENLNYSISVEPALNITTSASKVSLDLNPLTHDFDSQDLDVSVSTNNETGYKLYVNTSTTNLIERNDPNLTIETLDSEVSENDFTINKWGYKLNTENYLPFKSGTLLSYSYEAIENDSTNLTFAAKIDYKTKAGSYTLPLNFQATANPNIRYIQNFTNEDCKILASDNSYTVYDLRDENDYQVRYINGNCWMVQNLRYIGDSGSTSSQMILKSATTNIDEDKTINYEDLTNGNSYDIARLHNSSNTANGVWYNYAAASAEAVKGSSNSTTASYSLCPSSWRLPTNSEQSSIISQSSVFVPIAGGYYIGGALNNTGLGVWWSATSRSVTERCTLYWDGASLATNYGDRQYGRYVRCIRSN